MKQDGSRDPKSIRCVHCGRDLTKSTKDHVFPSAWYPSETPPDVQRWTVPSCSQCNNKFGAMERELFIRLAMCIDPQRAEAAGLSEKAVRSMGIGAEGISLKESLHRRALKLKIIASVWHHKPGTETLPGLGPHPGFPEDKQLAIPISANLMEEVVKKIVRGCEFELAKGRIIEEPYEIGISFVHEHNVPEAVNRAFQISSALKAPLGPGFEVTRVEAHDEPGAVMYKMVIWGTLVAYASILPKLA
ncbi:MAG: hypothetical protein WBQ09_01175 [Terriglobales bacterium]